MGDSSDRDIWNYALEIDAILVSKDEDFALMFRKADAPPALIWIRVGNTSSRALAAWFEPLLPKIEDLRRQGDRFVELR